MDRMDREVVRAADGPPWPEAIAGAVIGALLTFNLAFVPALASLVDPAWPGLWPLVVSGAALGAVVSYALAWRSSPLAVPDAKQSHEPDATRSTRAA